MSTTFGILKENVEHEKLVDKDGDLLDYISRGIFEEVFFRTSRYIWLSTLGPYLADETKVYALDNSQQGVFTIKDCKDLIKKQNQENEDYN